jgi:hypothetical protein
VKKLSKGKALARFMNVCYVYTGDLICCFIEKVCDSLWLVFSERGAAWLAHLSGGQGVGGSNPPAPTNHIGRPEIIIVNRYNISILTTTTN